VTETVINAQSSFTLLDDVQVELRCPVAFATMAFPLSVAVMALKVAV
jgi:hypothetical protein